MVKEPEAVQVPAPEVAKRLGLLVGSCQVPDEFDELGAEEIADLFEGLSPDVGAT